MTLYPTDDRLMRALMQRPENSFSYWQKLAKDVSDAGESETHINYAAARAYVSDDGFYPFLHDILEYTDLYPRYHKPIVDACTSPKPKRMIQAFRGSFKSSIATIGFTTWLLARENVLRNGKTDMRILIGSEVLELCEAFCGAARQVLEETPDYIDLFGNHKPSEGRSERRKWHNYRFTSRYRTLARLPENTVQPISIEATKTGTHYEVIVLDDLETERQSASRDQINKVWRMYRLCWPLLVGKSPNYLAGDDSPYPILTAPIMQLVSTRWHHDDIYTRIGKDIGLVWDRKEENKALARDPNWHVVIQPAQDHKGNPTFPSHFPREKLDELKREKGTYLYSGQYDLDPQAPEDQQFKRSWLQYVRPEHFTRPNTRTYVVADLAYVEQERIESGDAYRADETWIMTILVDPFYNFIQKDVWHGRVGKLKAVEEMFRQYFTHGAINLGLQKYDKSYIDEVINQVAFDQGRKPKTTYISYPPKRTKQDRIHSLFASFEQGKWFLLPGFPEQEEQLMTFPNAVHDDAPDCMANMIAIAKPEPSDMPHPKYGAVYRHIKSLHSKEKSVVDLQGNKTYTDGSKHKRWEMM